MTKLQINSSDVRPEPLLLQWLIGRVKALSGPNPTWDGVMSNQKAPRSNKTAPNDPKIVGKIFQGVSSCQTHLFLPKDAEQNADHSG